MLPKGCEVSGRGLPVYGKRAESVSPLWVFIRAGTDQKHVSQEREGKSKVTGALKKKRKSIERADKLQAPEEVHTDFTEANSV